MRGPVMPAWPSFTCPGTAACGASFTRVRRSSPPATILGPDGGLLTTADWAHLTLAYEHLFDLALAQARRDGVTIELPLSGQGGVVGYAKAIEAHMERAIADSGADPGLFVQSQAWGLNGSNQVPLGGEYWSCVAIPHGFQAAQVDTCSIDGGPPTDWDAMYESVRGCNGVFTEVYLASFACNDRSSQELEVQIARYAATEPPYAACPQDGGDAASLDQ